MLFVYNRVSPYSGLFLYQERLCKCCTDKRNELARNDKKFKEYVKSSYRFAGLRINDNSPCDKCKMNEIYP